MQRRALTLSIFVGALVLTGLFYLIVFFAAKHTAAFPFFCGHGWYQPAGVVFLFFGLLLVAARWRSFQTEATALDLALASTPAVTREQALSLADDIPAHYRPTLLGRRLENLLRGYARGDEVGAMAERLSKADFDDLERSASTIAWVRALPLLIGLFGALAGLRAALAQMSAITNSSDVEQLRRGLQTFAGNAGAAFDTVLMGIAAAAIVSAALFIERRLEDEHLREVDTVSAELANKFIDPRGSGPWPASAERAHAIR